MIQHPLLPFWQVSQQDRRYVQITNVVVQKRHHTCVFPTDRWASRIVGMSSSACGGSETPLHLLFPNERWAWLADAYVVSKLRSFGAVFGIFDILVWIRIRGSMPLIRIRIRIWILLFSSLMPTKNQCGGSGMLSRIPDPTFFHSGSELSPSRIRTVSIPDPHQRIAQYFNHPKKSKKMVYKL